MRRAARIAALLLAGAAGTAAQERRSGYADMSPQLQRMQDDDGANPGMLWVQEGEELWSRPEGGVSCAGCHGAAPASMRGVAARYPAFDKANGEAVDLAGRINLCRERHQAAQFLPRESEPLLALTTFIAAQSRGMPVAPPPDPRLAAARDLGERLWGERRGQLDLSCAECHDRRAGRHLGGSLIPQGHANGYPLYRLEWQAVGSLQRRLRNCMVGVRAEAFAFGSPEFIGLEAYLASRGTGLPVEAPAIRP